MCHRSRWAGLADEVLAVALPPAQAAGRAPAGAFVRPPKRGFPMIVL